MFLLYQLFALLVDKSLFVVQMNKYNENNNKLQTSYPWLKQVSTLFYVVSYNTYNLLMVITRRGIRVFEN